ncbi:MAG: DNA replication/repair protein RecF [Bacteroidales bacterium]|nr:DNA replication/repair protein RecF [Bacteroidales bacterium]
MYLKELSILNFKNFPQEEMEFCPRLNVFLGNNGAGKTNLMDAIYYLSFCKSYFNNIDSQSIRHDENFLMIQGNYLLNDKNEAVLCSIKKGQKKQFKRNRKDYEKLSDHIGLLPLVMVSPSDIKLILDGSDVRRKFVNGVISQYDKEYLEDLLVYQKALAQRNALLKDFASKRHFDAVSLEIWTEPIIETGERIHKKRLEYIKEFIPIFNKHYNFISGENEIVSLEYSSQLDNEDFREVLKRSLEKDRQFQYTTAGIHKDDLELSLGGYPIKQTGSQGQKKSYLVALKLAQFDFIKKVTGITPIFLLDDIFDKLDRHRVAKILELVAGNNFGQIFITDTGPERIDPILKGLNAEYRIFTIQNNSALLNP